METEILYFDKEKPAAKSPQGLEALAGVSTAVPFTAQPKNLRGVGVVPKTEKEVWEMTFEEYLKTRKTYQDSLAKFYSYGAVALPNGYKQYGNQELKNKKATSRKLNNLEYTIKESHKKQIQTAILKNKNIPAEVLAEYPDLLREKAKSLLQQYKNDNEGLQGLDNSKNQGLAGKTPISSKEIIAWLVDIRRKGKVFFEQEKPEDLHYAAVNTMAIEVHDSQIIRRNYESDDKIHLTGTYFRFNKNTVEKIKEHLRLKKIDVQTQNQTLKTAKKLFVLYKNDTNGLAGIKKSPDRGLGGLINFTAYITAANPRLDKQGRGKLLVQAQKDRVKALKTNNITLLRKSERTFERLKKYNQKVFCKFELPHAGFAAGGHKFDVIGYWNGQPEPSMQLDFGTNQLLSFWQTIRSLAKFAQTHSQDAFIVALPLNDTEKRNLHTIRVLDYDDNGFQYIPTFFFEFKNLSATEQIAVESCFYEKFATNGFTMYLYKQIKNKDITYKLFYTNENDKTQQGINKYKQEIRQTLDKIADANAHSRTILEGVQRGYEALDEQSRKNAGRPQQDYEKVMFFEADNFVGDSRSYAGVLAEISERMRGLGKVAGLGGFYEKNLNPADKKRLQNDFDKTQKKHQSFKTDTLRFIAMVEETIFLNWKIDKAEWDNYLKLWATGKNVIAFDYVFEQYFNPIKELALLSGFDYEKKDSEHRFFSGNYSFFVDTSTQKVKLNTPTGSQNFYVDYLVELKKQLNSPSFSLENLQYWNFKAPKPKTSTAVPKLKSFNLPMLADLEFNLQQAKENGLTDLAAYFHNQIDTEQYTTPAEIAAKKEIDAQEKEQLQALQNDFEQASAYPISSEFVRNEQKNYAHRHYFELAAVELYKEVKQVVPHDFFGISYSAYKLYAVFDFLTSWQSKGTAAKIEAIKKEQKSWFDAHTKYFKKDGGLKSQYQYTQSARKIIANYENNLNRYDYYLTLLGEQKHVLELYLAAQQAKTLLVKYKNDRQGLI